MPKEQQTVNFDAIKIGLASPERILQWSRGEVTKPETINYRTLKPEVDGLFCERIFGPSKDWECHCGKYKKNRHKGVICDKCGVEVTKAKVRRERMGHIKLAAPVSHIWYFKGIPSRMGLILDISPKKLEKVLYFASYIVLDPGETDLRYKQVLSDKDYHDALDKYGDVFRVGLGAEAIEEILAAIDLEKESKELKQALRDTKGQKKARIIKRLEVVEAFRSSENRPEWMILTHIPVIPPDLRPMVQLDGGRFATSDLNDLYRRVINRNNRLSRLMEIKAPEIIIRNEKRMLQEAVDALIDNGRRGRPVTGPGNRPLKSLSDMLKGKQGRFRQNLLGKRVDYSGRSVIVVGPELKIYQCGLPKKMAIELFKPFIMKRLVEDEMAHNIKSAKKMVDRLDPYVFDVLEEVISEHPVMLNRAPTLHRLGIQAFEPVLVEGKAIRLHPLVCTAFNADFDGDQMAVHLPLSEEAQAECRFLLLSPNNLLKPSDGGPVCVPSQDVVLGIYYLTLQKEEEKGEGNVYSDENEALLAYDNKVISLHAKIKVQRTMEIDGEKVSTIVETTPGRIIFNEIIPQDLGFVERETPESELLYEIDFLVGKKQLQKILHRCIDIHGSTKTSEVLDNIKHLGFKYSTRGAITVALSDMEVPENKGEILEQAEGRVETIVKQFRRGMMTEDERYLKTIQTWKNADDQITEALLKNLGRYNNIFMMADSGARGSNNQIKQLVGMRGLMADTQGRTIELPIKSNFREGLDVLEYFISAHGARKGLADIALRTADSGYLTRRLVDVSQDLIIRELDCCEGSGEVVGLKVKAFMDSKEVIESLEERITGRWAVEDIKHPQTGKLLVPADSMINPRQARKIIAAGIEEVKIRTALTCRSKVGVCAKCYGADMATGRPVQVGEAVGIIAAQSIGEPGTQLTMRNFHSGGIATAEDITQGLPRVEELFEARKPKGLAILSEFAGRVTVSDSKKKREVIVTNDETGSSKAYLIPYGSRIKVEDGQMIEAGDELTEGSVNPHDILKIKNSAAVEDYMLQEVQRVYRLQGVEINDKHIEVIVRQMLKKVKIEDNGDTDLLPGVLADRLEFENVNREMREQGLEEATGTQVLLGITKASLATKSFLSAASFQETTKVLTEAAIFGKVDPLIGLKENVILGKLIPAGTGMNIYRDVEISNMDETMAVEEEVTE
ncbi:DNA-directed RNA polymerase subunit beta' [Clostridiales bacterium COT073_COT-073]|nr:DNA-directed RNA polymerase subunit beta' [Clostridiales bacterium COT073_COT-073]